MAGKLFVRYQTIDHTGEVLGSFAAQPCGVRWHGFMFSNSAGAVGSVAIWVPTQVATANGQIPAVPSASGTQIGTIQIPANSSKEFYADEGVYFKDGAFLIASATTITGFAIVS
jgi:hypothetical protein